MGLRRPGINRVGFRRVGSGGGGSGVSGYLSELYALGLADDPVADNTLVGDPWQTYFTPEGSISLDMADYLDALSDLLFPAVNIRRWADNPIQAPLTTREVAKYDVPSTPSSNIGGGVLHAVGLEFTDSGGVATPIEEELIVYHPSLQPGYYDPPYPWLTNDTLHFLDMRTRAGTIANRHLWTGDGVYVAQPRLPDDTAARTVGGVTLQLSRLSGGMWDGQGGGFWVGGRDGLNFAQGMGRFDVRWITANPVNPTSQIELYSYESFAWQEALFTSGAETEVFGDLLADADLDVLGSGTIAGDLDVTGTVTAGEDLFQTSGLGVPVVGFSAEIDMTQAPGTTFTIVPARTGYAFVPIRTGCIITQLSGFTSTSQVKIGVNGAHDNFNGANAFPSAAQVALGVGAESSAGAATGGKLLASNTAVTGEITVAAVATTLKARFYYQGFWRAL